MWGIYPLPYVSNKRMTVILYCSPRHCSLFHWSIIYGLTSDVRQFICNHASHDHACMHTTCFHWCTVCFLIGHSLYCMHEQWNEYSAHIAVCTVWYIMILLLLYTVYIAVIFYLLWLYYYCYVYIAVILSFYSDIIVLLIKSSADVSSWNIRCTFTYSFLLDQGLIFWALNIIRSSCVVSQRQHFLC